MVSLESFDKRRIYQSHHCIPTALLGRVPTKIPIGTQVPSGPQTKTLRNEEFFILCHSIYMSKNVQMWVEKEFPF